MNAHQAQAPSAASGSKSKNTIYVAGFAQEVNEQQLLDAFVTFGEWTTNFLVDGGWWVVGGGGS